MLQAYKNSRILFGEAEVMAIKLKKVYIDNTKGQINVVKIYLQAFAGFKYSAGYQWPCP